MKRIMLFEHLDFRYLSEKLKCFLGIAKNQKELDLLPQSSDVLNDFNAHMNIWGLGCNGEI